MQKDTRKSKNSAEKGDNSPLTTSKVKQKPVTKNFEVEEVSEDKPPKKVSEAGTVTGWQMPQTRKRLAYGIFTALFVMMVITIITGNFAIVGVLAATGFGYAARRIIDFYYPQPLNRQKLSEMFMRYLVVRAELKAGRKEVSIVDAPSEPTTPLIEEKTKDGSNRPS